jgi:hypothetical protein
VPDSWQRAPEPFAHHASPKLARLALSRCDLVRASLVSGVFLSGHSFTEATLLASRSEKIEEMRWISLPMFEERKNLLKSMAKTVHRRLRHSSRQRLGETQGYIDRLRGMLLTPESQSADDTLTRVKGLTAEPPRAKSTR